MAAEYFPCLFRLGSADHYVIWHADDRDGLVRENGRVVTFPSLAELHAYAVRRGLELQPAEVARYDWDSIERWCDEPVAGGIAAGPFLNAWNMVLDTLPACVLKGAKPAELPFEQVTKLELVVNLKTAKALGLAIPHPFLLRVDRVIE